MENNTSSLMKLTLYDRIFKPQTVTLPNGHSVQRCRSRTPVIVLFLAVAIWLSLRMTGFDLHVVITKFRKMVDLLEKILQPDWSFFPKVVSPLIDTIKMSILGTVIGCVLALPVAILSSSNINKSIPVVWLIRFLLGRGGVKGSDWRGGEDDLRILVQRAGQGHALLLTAGELVTAGIGLIQNAYLVQTL